MATEFLTKEIVVYDEPIVMFSLDGWRWSSNRNEIMECERRREKLVAEMARSLKRSATFSHETRPQRRE